MYKENISQKNISQEFRLKNMDETRNHLIEEINRNKLMSKKNKKFCTTLNYIEHFCFFYFSWYSNRNHEFSNRIKNLCNSWRN